MLKSAPLVVSPNLDTRMFFNWFLLISLFHKCVSMMGMLLCIQLFVKLLFASFV